MAGGSGTLLEPGLRPALHCLLNRLEVAIGGFSFSNCHLHQCLNPCFSEVDVLMDTTAGIYHLHVPGWWLSSILPREDTGHGDLENTPGQAFQFVCVREDLGYNRENGSTHCHGHLTPPQRSRDLLCVNITDPELADMGTDTFWRILPIWGHPCETVTVPIH